MGNTNTTGTLGLGDYTRNDENLNSVSARSDLAQDMANINLFAGGISGSLSTRFGTRDIVASTGSSGLFLGSAFATADRIITGVRAWTTSTGSGGVTTVDLQKPLAAGLGYASLFVGDASHRLALSSSLATFTVVSGGTSALGDGVLAFVSGVLPTWQTGTILKCVFATTVVTSGPGAQGIDVEVFWKPSGSFYAG